VSKVRGHPKRKKYCVNSTADTAGAQKVWLLLLALLLKIHGLNQQILQIMYKSIGVVIAGDI